MNESLDQFLNDFYGKYSKEPLTPEKIAKIKSTYGDDHDSLINDLYKKYAPDKMPDSDKLSAIKSTYGFSGSNSPANPSVSDYAGHFAGQVNKGLINAAGSMLKGTAELVTPQAMGKVDESPLYMAGQGLEDLGAKYVEQTNPDIQKAGGATGFLMNNVPQGIGSAEAFALTLGVGAGARAGELPALSGQVMSGAKQLGQSALEGIKSLGSPTGITGGVSAVDEAFQEARNAGLDDKKALAAGIQNYLGGATEAAPLEHMFGRFAKLTGRSITDIGKQMLTGGVEESLQEGLQKYWSNKVAEGNYDPDRDPMMGVLEDAGTAFVVGMVLPFAMHGLSGVGYVQDKIVERLQRGRPADTASAFDAAAPDTGDHNLNTTIDEMSIEVSNDIKAMSSRKGKAKTEKIVEMSKEDKDITGELDEPLSAEQAQYEARMEAMAEKINQSKQAQKNAVQVGSPAEVPVGEQTTPSGEVGTRVPESVTPTGIPVEGESQTVQTPESQESVRSSRRKRGPVRDLTKPVVVPETHEEFLRKRDEDRHDADAAMQDEYMEDIEREKKEAETKKTETKKKVVAEAKEKEIVPDKVVAEKIKGQESLLKIKNETPKKQIARLEKFIETYAAHQDLVKSAQKQLTRVKGKQEEKAELKERKAAKAKMQAEDIEQEEKEPTFEDLEKEDKALHEMLGTDEFNSDDVEYSRSPGKLTRQDKEAGQESYPLSKSTTSNLTKMRLKRKDLREVSHVEFVRSLPTEKLRSAAGAMLNVLRAYRGKKSNLRILVIPRSKLTRGEIGGFIATKPDSKSAIMVVPEMANDTTDIAVHELVHDYTLMMSRFLYKNDPRFGEEINKIYKNGFVNLIDIIRGGIKTELEAILTGEDLEGSPEFTEFLRYLHKLGGKKGGATALDAFVTEMSELSTKLREGGRLKATNYELNVLAAIAINRVYGFTNPKEMLSEAFSNPEFMQVLAAIPSTRQESKAGKQAKRESLLYKLYKSVLNYFQAALREVHHNSVLKDLMNTVTEYDLKFKAGNLQEAILEDPIWEDLHKGNVMHSPTKPKSKDYDRGIVNSIVDKIESRDDINTAEDISKVVDSINKNIAEPLSPDYVRYIEKALKKRRDQFDDAELLKTDAEATIVDNDYYNSNASFRNIVDKSFQIEYKKLPKKDRKAYIDGLIALASKQVPEKGFFDVTEKYEAQERVDRLTKSGLDFANIHNAFVKMVIKNGANPATLVSLIGKYNKKASTALFTELYGNMLHMSTQAEVAAKKFMDDLYSVSKRHKTSAVDHVRTQMYGAAYATKAAPNTETYWKEVEANLDQIIENSQNKLDARKSNTWKDQSISEVEKELEIAKQLKKDILSKKGVAEDGEILTPGQLALYQTFRKFAEEQKDAILLNTQGVWGSDKFQPLYNYMPTSAIGKIRKGTGSAANLQADEIIDNGEESLTAALNQPEYGQLMASRSGFTKAKVQPKGYFYDYNLLSLATKWSKSILFDTNMSHEVKVLNRMLNHSPQLVKSLGEHNIEIFNDQIKGILGAGRKYSSENMRQMQGVFKFVDTYAEALMTTSGQFVTQLSSAIPAAMIVKPRGFAKALKVMAGLEKGTMNGDKVHEFLEKHGMGIQTRDIQFEKFTTIEDYNQAGLSRGLSNLTGKAREINSFILRSTDKAAARLVWFSAFFDAGGTLEAPTKEAVLEAERAVGQLQNMSNMTFSANVFKSNDVWARIGLKMFYNFKAFALNAALNQFGSAAYLFNKNSDEARPVFAASLAMILAYETAAKMLVKPAYEGLTGLLTGGDDDDDDEKRYSWYEDLISNATWDALAGQILPDMLSSVIKYGYNKTIATTLHKHEGEKFDQYKDSPIYSKKTIGEAVGDFGAAGDLIIKGTEAGVGLYPLAQQLIDTEAAEENPANTPEKVQNAALEAAGLIIAEFSLFPLRGDARKIIETYRRQASAEIRNGASSGSATTGGGSVHPIQSQTLRSFSRRAHRQQISPRTR